MRHEHSAADHTRAHRLGFQADQPWLHAAGGYVKARASTHPHNSIKDPAATERDRVALPSVLPLYIMLVKTVDLVDHAVDVLVEMGLEILEVNARLHAGLDMGDAADIAAVHGEDGGEEVFHVLGIGRTII